MASLASWALLVLALPAAAQTVAPVTILTPAAPIPTGPRGAYLNQLQTQVQTLLSVPAPLPQAFRSTLLAQPEVPTPAAFAARAALVQALAQPSGLKKLAEAVRTHEGDKGKAAAKSLSKLAEAIRESPGAERKSLGAEARALATRFDGAAAAPGEAVDLEALPTVEDGPGRTKARKLMKETRDEIDGLQEKLDSGKVRGVLVVMQGMDSAGKGGTTKRPLKLNPAWTRFAAFKKPTKEEAAQHFLKRVEDKLGPGLGRGFIQIFDRSHYEDLVMPAILKTHSPEEIEARYRQVLEFEKKLAEAGIVVVKLFFHVSPEEQRRRLDARIEDETKHTKASQVDWEMHRRFPEFMKVWGEVLARTSTPWAPWNVIPADNKPRRDLAVAQLVLKTLKRMGLDYGRNPELAEVKKARDQVTSKP